MEQYWMPKNLDFRNLILCLDNYIPIHLFIRDCGGIRENGKYDCHGKAKVNADLKDKILDFRKDKSGLHFLIDTWPVFHFPLRGYYKGFSLAYERIEKSEEGFDRMIILSHGVDPYDPKLPEPQKSILRNVIDNHLIEIEFQGRINLKFHSWKDKPHWKYWTIDKLRD